MSNNVPWLMPHNFRPEGVQKTVDRYNAELALFENMAVPDTHFLHYAARRKLDALGKSLPHKHQVSSTFHKALALCKVPRGSGSDMACLSRYCIFMSYVIIT
jgi:hypothetical protein